MKQLHEIAVEALRRRGIDPDAPAVEPPEFDPEAWRVEQAQVALSNVIPYGFTHATADHPRVAEWVEAFLADRHCPSLLLAGERGTGKTHLAYGALRKVAITAARSGKPVRFRAVTHPQLNQLLRPKSDHSHEYALDPYLEAELLILDDLGAGKQSDWTADSLHRLVDHRWAERLPTIYTTNLAPDDLAEAVGERVVSRVFDGMRLMLRGADRRRTAGGAQ